MGGELPRQRDKEFPLMDSLRALGALGVLAVHAWHSSGALPPDSGWREVVMRFDVAVPVFFVISGFLLYRPFVRAHLAESRAPDAIDYGWRRFLRIVPGYWVALTVVALWIGLTEVFTPGGVVTYYGFAQVYRAETFGGGLIQGWTVAIEVAFYAFLPIYALLLRALLRRRRAWRLRGEVTGVAVLFVASVAYTGLALAALGPLTADMAPILSAFPAFLSQFAVGMAIAIWSVQAELDGREPGPLRSARSVIERRPAVPLAGAGVCFLLLAFGLKIEHPPLTDWEWLGRHLLNTAIAGLVLLPTVFGDRQRGWSRRVLGLRPLLYLGTISYGFYLYHVGVLHQLGDFGLADALGTGAFAYAAWLALGTAGALALGTASWYLLERPAMRQIRRIRAWRAGRGPGDRPPRRTGGPRPATVGAAPEG